MSSYLTFFFFTNIAHADANCDVGENRGGATDGDEANTITPLRNDINLVTSLVTPEQVPSLTARTGHVASVLVTTPTSHLAQGDSILGCFPTML